jgi:hypothetical protein
VSAEGTEFALTVDPGGIEYLTGKACAYAGINDADWRTTSTESADAAIATENNGPLNFLPFVVGVLFGFIWLYLLSKLPSKLR